jgi:hypothetical protein
VTGSGGGRGEVGHHLDTVWQKAGWDGGVVSERWFVLCGLGAEIYFRKLPPGFGDEVESEAVDLTRDAEAPRCAEEDGNR